MQFRLRWKILLFTVLPPVTLTAATLWVVNRGVSRQVESSIHENLSSSALVIEHLLATRAQRLRVAAETLAGDPRFSSLLAVPEGGRDPGFRATVQTVARDFDAITGADLFEVFDRRGSLIASAGRVASAAADVAPWVRSALAGQPVSSVLAENGAHAQLVLVPVVARGGVRGALMLGAEIGAPLAHELEALTHGEVAFLSRGRCTGSTFEFAGDQEVLLRALARGTRTGTVGDEAYFVMRGHAQTYLALARRVPNSTADQAQFYAMLRPVEAETAYLHDTQRRMIELGAIAALLAALAGWLIAERVTRPVGRLVRAAEEMERGNYDFPMEVKARDEVGELAERFRSMRRLERAYVNSLNEVTRMKGEFINVASHELRTPVSVIQGYVELLAEGALGSVSPRQHEAIAEVTRSLERLTALAEEATRMAQIERQGEQPAATDHTPAGIVRSAIEAARPSERGGEIPVRLECGPGLSGAGADPRGLGEAVAHLVRAALDCAHDRGSVTVGLRRDGELLEVEVCGSSAAGENPADDRFNGFAAAWDAGPSSERAPERLGLGIAIARGFAEASGGELRTETRPGHQCRFVLRIPLGESSERSAA